MNEEPCNEMVKPTSSGPRLQMMVWRPIETAPRDGTQILVTDGRVQEFWQVVSWETGENDMRTGWTDAEGSLCYHPEAFTDWMPLPTPPQRI